MLLFALTTLFALVTLPVEFNASNRAKKKLKELGITKNDEDKSVDDMLDAAAFAYVAAFATSAIQLFYWSLTVRGELDDNGEPAASKTRKPTTFAEVQRENKAAAEQPSLRASATESTSEATYDDRRAPAQSNGTKETRAAASTATGAKEAETKAAATKATATESAGAKTTATKAAAKALTTAGDVAKKRASGSWPIPLRRLPRTLHNATNMNVDRNT